MVFLCTHCAPSNIELVTVNPHDVTIKMHPIYV